MVLAQQGQSCQQDAGNNISASRATTPVQHRQQHGPAGVVEGNLADFNVGGKFAKGGNFAVEGNFAKDDAFAKEGDSAEDGNFVQDGDFTKGR
jgi:hypothetical protein